MPCPLAPSTPAVLLSSPATVILLLLLLLANVSTGSMQGPEQLPALSAAEDAGQHALARQPSQPQLETRQDRRNGSISAPVSTDQDVSPPLYPRARKSEKRARKPSPSPAGAYLQPLPTIETIMTYPSLTRPVYDSLVRGDPPAKTYHTIVRSPKPPAMRVLDNNLLRAAEIQAQRRRKRAGSARSRSSTASSTASSSSNTSSSSSAGRSAGSVAGESDSSASDVSEPSTPLSASAASKSATGALPPSWGLPYPSLSSHPLSPAPDQSLYYPPIVSTERDTDMFMFASDSAAHSSGASSPAESFHSSFSALSSSASDVDVESTAATLSSSRSAAPSPASAAYPSPPASPRRERRESASAGEDYLAYPSPPPSPSPGAGAQQQQRPVPPPHERLAFTFPPPPNIPSLTGLSASPDIDSELARNAHEFDLGEQTLGGGMLFDDDDDSGDDDMEWSMNGGTLVFALGAAGVAMSPRAMEGGCCGCNRRRGRGLGLYVIDEEDEEVGGK
ncbi:hypothetical protein BDV95DRAFT_607068 [Massariosphaeria phaeospora]|uniref:Uncharacterized protein n=1 Tax=Massariosphaeria phaeospora TaxID=100035 RepID=A0A7C8I811_9PLEO|nr:hypothetical protein BDV95DRAFT_607068 [Massariosphaeria phaeospora]